MSLQDIRHQFVLPASIDEVWNAVTTSEGLAAWLMPNDFEAVVGRKFTFRLNPQGDWSGITYCEVLEIDESHRVSFSWSGDPDDENPTIVTFELDEVNGGTEFKLLHTGWEKQPESLLPIMRRDSIAEGWAKEIQVSLKRYLGN